MAEQYRAVGSLALALAGLPLVVRRRILRGLFVAVSAFRRDGRAGHQAVFERHLRLPRRHAHRLDREAAFHDIAAEIEWLALLRRARTGIRRDLARTTVRDPETLRRIAETGRPVILAPLHMGNYVVGLAHTMLTYFPGRPLLILRRRDDMPRETRVMERIREFGIDMRFLNVTARADYLSAVRFAREGAIVVVFCDLPPSYGKAADMPMFGLPLRFALGLDALAHLTGAAVVPLATIAEIAGDAIQVGRPFDVDGSGPEERLRVAGLIREHIRGAIQSRPEQWHLWSTLGEYLPAPETVTASTPDPRPESFADAAE